MSISLEHVTKRYGDIAVVDDVTLEIPHGSLTAVLGPSGSGKSTLLKLISGLERLDTGRVIIDGDDVTDIDPRHRDIGFCFQHYAPFRHLSVRRNVAFGLEIRRRPKPEIARRVDELLELVGLSALSEFYGADGKSGPLSDAAAAAQPAYPVK